MYLSSADNCSVVRLRTSTHSYVRTHTHTYVYVRTCACVHVRTRALCEQALDSSWITRKFYAAANVVGYSHALNMFINYLDSVNMNHLPYQYSDLWG